jgi:hypothetical protein
MNAIHDQHSLVWNCAPIETMVVYKLYTGLVFLHI